MRGMNFFLFVCVLHQLVVCCCLLNENVRHWRKHSVHPFNKFFLHEEGTLQIKLLKPPFSHFIYLFDFSFANFHTKKSPPLSPVFTKTHTPFPPEKRRQFNTWLFVIVPLPHLGQPLPCPIRAASRTRPAARTTFAPSPWGATLPPLVRWCRTDPRISLLCEPPSRPLLQRNGIISPFTLSGRAKPRKTKCRAVSPPS